AARRPRRTLPSRRRAMRPGLPIRSATSCQEPTGPPSIPIGFTPIMPDALQPPPAWPYPPRRANAKSSSRRPDCDEPKAAGMKHCLVVDDSAVIRKVARRILEELNFTAAEGENGRDALDQCRASMPDVVLLDWNMPVMDGIAFLVALRRE